MILIVESGSTKTEWRLSQGGRIVSSFKTQGFNPRIQSKEEMMVQFANIFDQYLLEKKPAKLFFYGAGLGDPEAKVWVKEGLQELIPGVNISVEHDMLAAARSTCRPEGIVCILGTGSNSCYHQYFQVVEVRGGLGFIIGDEGSGADLGRFLLKGWLEGEFPIDLSQLLFEKFGAPPQEVLTNMMLEEKPNVCMSRWAEYIREFLHFPVLEKLVVNRFLAFLDKTVCAYDLPRKVPVDFVGSVSYYFKSHLLQACQLRDIQIGRVTKDPVESLVAFHLEHPEVV